MHVLHLSRLHDNMKGLAPVLLPPIPSLKLLGVLSCNLGDLDTQRELRWVSSIGEIVRILHRPVSHFLQHSLQLRNENRMVGIVPHMAEGHCCSCCKGGNFLNSQPIPPNLCPFKTNSLHNKYWFFITRDATLEVNLGIDQIILVISTMPAFVIIIFLWLPHLKHPCIS